MAKCCFETDQCQIDGARADGEGSVTLTSPSFESCEAIQNYAESTGGNEGPKEFGLNGARMYILIAMLIWLVKAAYTDVVIPLGTQGVFAFLPKWMKPKKTKVLGLDENPENEAETDNSYTVYVESSWQIKFAGGTLPVILLFGWLAFDSAEDIDLFLPLHFYRGRPDLYSEYPTISNHAILCVAIFLDLHMWYHVARYHICLLPFWIPKVEIDISPSVNAFTVGKQQIALPDVKDVTRFNEKWCKFLGFNYILITWPWVTISFLIANSNWLYQIDYGISALMATFTCLRIYFGPDLVVKCYWALQFILSTDPEIRDTLGMATCSIKTLVLAGAVAFLCSTVVSVGMTMGVTGRQLEEDPGFISTCSTITFVLGSYVGALHSVFMYLPVTPRFFLTRISSGIYIQYIHKRQFSSRLLTVLHSNEEMLILFVEDEVGLKKALKGGEGDDDA